jgi:hypothetical protein
MNATGVEVGVPSAGEYETSESRRRPVRLIGRRRVPATCERNVIDVFPESSLRPRMEESMA